MQLEQVVTKLIKFMKARSEALALSVTSGSIDNMEKYRYIIGQIAAIEAVLQELSNLLEDKEQNGKGTVINIDPKSKIKVPEKKLVGVESKKEEPKLPKPTG